MRYGGRTDGLRALVDWLQGEMGIPTSSHKLSELIDRPPDELIAGLETLRPKKAGFSVAELKRLKDEYQLSVVPLQAQARTIAQLEVRVSDVVNAAFGLTPYEVKLMWDTAPPRMPVAAPPTG